MKVLSKIPVGGWITLLIVVVSCLLIFLASVSQPPPPATTPPPPPGQDAGIVLDEPISPVEFPYIGIKSDDTVAVFNEAKETVVIGLTHNKWTKPSWSPERTHIAALGIVGANNTEVADLFIYELATNKWTRATSFSTAIDNPPGINGYDWISNTMIAFSQGDLPEKWAHTYDIVSGEIKKVFRVPGTIEYYQRDSERYMVKVARFEQETDPVYQILNRTGVAIYIFDSENLPENYNIETVLPGRTTNEYLVRAISGTGSESFLWNFSGREFELLPVELDIDIETASGVLLEGLPIAYLCSINESELLALAGNPLLPGSFQILKVSLDAESSPVSAVAVLEPGSGWEALISKSVCQNGTMTIPLTHTQIANRQAWWRFNGTDVIELEAARNYTAITN